MAGNRKKSMTRSAKNFKPLKLYTFFLDRALESYVLRDAVKALGARVQMHRDHFREDADDVDWLPVMLDASGLYCQKISTTGSKDGRLRMPRVAPFYW